MKTSFRQCRIARWAALLWLAAPSLSFALYTVTNRGAWPAGWPGELEPLRAQSRTLVGPMVLQSHYEIPFARREDFEAAWPHLLKVKSPGAPIFLVRAPDRRLGLALEAGVRIYAPPPQTSGRPMPEEPLPGEWGANARSRWIHTTHVEVAVDGKIVDLNRIPLPADTPILDERFRDGERK